MPYLDALICNAEQDDDIALARLGAAAVLLWNDIDPKVRTELLALAPTLVGLTPAPRCAAALERLITRNSAGSVAHRPWASRPQNAAA